MLEGPWGARDGDVWEPVWPRRSARGCATGSGATRSPSRPDRRIRAGRRADSSVPWNEGPRPGRARRDRPVARRRRPPGRVLHRPGAPHRGQPRGGGRRLHRPGGPEPGAGPLRPRPHGHRLPGAAPRVRDRGPHRERRTAHDRLGPRVRGCDPPAVRLSEERAPGRPAGEVPATPGRATPAGSSRSSRRGSRLRLRASRPAVYRNLSTGTGSWIAGHPIPSA